MTSLHKRPFSRPPNIPISSHEQVILPTQTSCSYTFYKEIIFQRRTTTIRLVVEVYRNYGIHFNLVLSITVYNVEYTQAHTKIDIWWS